jgi:hypothetical protein
MNNIDAKIESLIAKILEYVPNTIVKKYTMQHNLVNVEISHPHTSLCFLIQDIGGSEDMWYTQLGYMPSGDCHILDDIDKFATMWQTCVKFNSYKGMIFGNTMWNNLYSPMNEIEVFHLIKDTVTSKEIEGIIEVVSFESNEISYIFESSLFEFIITPNGLIQFSVNDFILETLVYTDILEIVAEELFPTNLVRQAKLNQLTQ